MVWRGSDYRKSRCVVHAFLEGKSLERSETLIVVHCKDSVVLAVVAQAEESVRRIRAECKDSLFHCLLNSRKDDLAFLVSEKTAVTAVRVQTEHSNLWRVYAEVSLEGTVHKAELLEDVLFCNVCGHILERDMACHDTHLEVVANHNHSHFIHSELLLKILSVACVAESFRRHSPLVERSCHKHIDVAFLDVLNSSLKRSHCSLCRLRSRLAGLHEDILRKTVHDVDSLLVYVLR